MKPFRVCRSSFGTSLDSGLDAKPGTKNPVLGALNRLGTERTDKFSVNFMPMLVENVRGELVLIARAIHSVTQMQIITVTADRC